MYKPMTQKESYDDTQTDESYGNTQTTESDMDRLLIDAHLQEPDRSRIEARADTQSSKHNH